VAVCVSCKKNNGEVDSDKPDNPNKLVSYIYDRNTCVRYYYEYDNQNRLSKITITEYADFNGDGEDEEGNSWVYIVTYPSANTIYYDFGDDDIMILTLNNEGKMIKCDNIGRIDMFEYEGEYLKKHTSSMNAMENNYFWNDGGIDSMVCKYQSYNDEIITYTSTYTYCSVPDKEYSIAPWKFPSFGRVFPSCLLGKSTSYLLSSEIFEDDSSINYRYETNAEGYVTKVYLEDRNHFERLLFEVKYK